MCNVLGSVGLEGYKQMMKAMEWRDR